MGGGPAKKLAWLKPLPFVTHRAEHSSPAMYGQPVRTQKPFFCFVAYQGLQNKGSVIIRDWELFSA